MNAYFEKLTVMKTLKVLLLSIFAVTLLYTGSAQAESVCPDDYLLPTFDSAISPQKLANTVYARLNVTGKQSNARLYLNSIDGATCVPIGTQQLDSEKWIKIGTIDTSVTSDVSIIQMRLDDLDATQGASSPSVLLVPTTSAPCSDPNSCIVTFRGQSYTLTPRKISLNSDTLRVAQYSAIDDDISIKKTIYYSDDKVLYSTDGLGTKIDMRYLGYGVHNLKTSLVTVDGQVLSISEQVDIPPSIDSVMTPLFLKNLSTIRAVGTIVGALLIYWFIVAMLRRFIAYRHWKKTHIVTKMNPRQRATEPALSSTEMYAVLQKNDAVKTDIKLITGSLIIPSIVGMVLVILSIYVMGTFKVDGVSMETTLRNESTQWMYKLPVTVAKFNSGNVALKRGQVVVLHHDDNNLFIPTAETQKSFVVKRVIGLSGERVKVANGSIIVFSKNNPDGINPDKGTSWESVIVPSSGVYIDITLKEGELFVVGDDREYSIDSRSYGPVKSTDVVGIVLYKHKQKLTPYIEP